MAGKPRDEDDDVVTLEAPSDTNQDREEAAPRDQAFLETKEFLETRSSVESANINNSNPNSNSKQQQRQQIQMQGDVEYLKSHNVHLELDQMIREMLQEKPTEANQWMLRWFLERHRMQCEARYMHNSPQHRPHEDESHDEAPLEGETSGELQQLDSQHSQPEPLSFEGEE